MSGITEVAATWMWADAGFLHGLAKRDPLRWSTPVSIEDTIQELQEYTLKDPDRPITLKIQDAAGEQSPYLEYNFSNVQSAIEGLRKYQSDTAKSGTYLQGGGLRRHLTVRSTVTARFTGAGGGVKTFAFVWSEWRSVEEAIKELEVFGVSNKDSVVLQIKSFTPESSARSETFSPESSARFETGVDNADKAISILRGIQDVIQKLKDRKAGVKEPLAAAESAVSAPTKAEAEVQGFAAPVSLPDESVAATSVPPESSTAASGPPESSTAASEPPGHTAKELNAAAASATDSGPTSSYMISYGLLQDDIKGLQQELEDVSLDTPDLKADELEIRLAPPTYGGV